MSDPRHPTAEELALFASGELGETGFPGLEQHLVECDACASALVAEAQVEMAILAVRELESGELRARGYRVEQLLGEREGCRSFLARNASGHRVLIKELAIENAKDAHAMIAFEREAKVLASVRHPGVPRLLEHIGDSSSPRQYLVEEHVEGETLREHFRGERANEAALMAIARGVLDVLRHLHELARPVYHRDLRPEHIIIRRDGSIALIGFGIAREVTQSGIHHVTMVGELGYAPLSQLAGALDAKGDLHALGASLIEVATGRPAWKQTEHERSLAEARVSPELRAFLMRLIKRADRGGFGTAAEALHESRPKRRFALRPDRGTLFGAALMLVAASSAFTSYLYLQERANARALVARRPSHAARGVPAFSHTCRELMFSHGVGCGEPHTSGAGLRWEHAVIGVHRSEEGSWIGSFSLPGGASPDRFSPLALDISGLKMDPRGPTFYVSRASVAEVWILRAVDLHRAKPRFAFERVEGAPFGANEKIIGLGWDSKRRRLIVGLEGRPLRLYAYSPDEDGWSYIAYHGTRRARGITYVPERDRVAVYVDEREPMRELGLELVDIDSGQVEGLRPVPELPAPDTSLQMFGGPEDIVVIMTPENGAPLIECAEFAIGSSEARRFDCDLRTKSYEDIGREAQRKDREDVQPSSEEIAQIRETVRLGLSWVPHYPETMYGVVSHFVENGYRCVPEGRLRPVLWRHHIPAPGTSSGEGAHAAACGEIKDELRRIHRDLIDED